MDNIIRIPAFNTICGSEDKTAHQLNSDHFRRQPLLRRHVCTGRYSVSMILLGLQALLCAQVACAQVLKFSLRWENSPLSLQNSTPRAIELAYRYANQFRWSTIDSFQAKPCPCSSPVPSSPCGDITINLASNGVNVTRPVQFRWLQRGPPSPSVWSVDTISIRGSIYDDFDDQLYPK